jgi:hypothetical protein
LFIKLSLLISVEINIENKLRPPFVRAGLFLYSLKIKNKMLHVLGLWNDPD